jgi:hypothetical protein
MRAALIARKNLGDTGFRRDDESGVGFPFRYVNALQSVTPAKAGGLLNKITRAPLIARRMGLGVKPVRVGAQRVRRSASIPT